MKKAKSIAEVFITFIGFSAFMIGIMTLFFVFMAMSGQ